MFSKYDAMDQEDVVNASREPTTISKPNLEAKPIQFDNDPGQIIGKLKTYLDSYMEQPGAKDYINKTVLLDLLYGIGTSCSDEYKFSDGFDKFRSDLFTYLLSERLNNSIDSGVLPISNDELIRAMEARAIT